MRRHIMKQRLAATLAVAVVAGTLGLNYTNTYATDLIKENVISTYTTSEAVTLEAKAEVKSISEIRARVAEGTKGETVTFQGVVTRVNGSNMYVQEGNVGIYVYGSRKGDAVEEGDVVEVTATTDAYNSLIQVKSAAVTKMTTVEKVAPIEVTIEEYYASPDAYESVLIKFSNVVLGNINTGGSTKMTDATGAIDIYKIASGIKEGFEEYEVIAYGSRYGNTRQLTVVNPEDVTPTKGMSTISDQIVIRGEKVTLPKVEVVKEGQIVNCEINWNEAEVAAIDTDKIGTYKVTGELEGKKFECTIIVISEDGIKISDIQGADHTSVFENKTVSDIEGVVTVKNGTAGFYIESLEEDRDEDVATSEGIYVSASSTNAKKVNAGDIVKVTGRVEEKRSDAAQLSVTQIYSSAVTLTGENVIEEGKGLPAPVVIGEGGRIPPNKIIDNDGLTSFDPEEDSIDFFESLEGMRVQINGAQVVGSTLSDLTVVPDEGKHSANGLSPQGGVVITEDNLHPEIITLSRGAASVRTDLNVGDKFTDEVIGVMSYTGSVYKVLVSEQLPEVERATYNMSPVTTLSETEDGLRIASFNVENLGGTESQGKFDEIGKVIAENMMFPDIIGLEEVQDNSGVTDDGVVEADKVYTRIIEAIKAQKGSENIQYDYVEIAPVNNLDGGQPGGNIRVGMIYRKDRVQMVEAEKGDATTAVSVKKAVDGSPSLSLNPGRIAPSSEHFTDTRKSLVVEFMFKGEKVFVIANHLSSKGGDDAAYGSKQPFVYTSEVKRIEQAKVVNNFIKEILAVDKTAKVVVLGDMNDYQFSNPLKELAGSELYNMHYSLPETERFTYNYQGKLQVLDNILVTKYLEKATDINVININSICAKSEQLSDHDPIMIRLNMNKVSVPSSGSDDDDNSNHTGNSRPSSGGSGSGMTETGIITTTNAGKTNITLSDKFALSDLANDKVTQITYHAKKDNAYLQNVMITLDETLVNALNEKQKDLVVVLKDTSIIVPSRIIKKGVISLDIAKVDETSVKSVIPTNRKFLAGYAITLKVDHKEETNFKREIGVHFKDLTVANQNKLVAYALKDGKWEVLKGKANGDEFRAETSTSGQIVLAESIQGFNDIKGHWAQEAIEMLATRHLVIGTTVDTFSPKAQIKAGDFGTLLERLTGKEITVVNASKPLTRAEMAEMLKSAISEGEAVDVTNLATFKDIKNVTTSQKEALSYLLKEELLKGQSEAKMAPNTVLTRAEMSVVVARLLNK